MAVERVLPEIRAALLDSTQQGQEKRQEIINNTSQLKGYATVGMGVCGLITVVSLVASVSFPVIGILFTLIGSAATVLAHDMMSMCANIEEMTRNVFAQGVAALSEHQFTTALTKDTWVVGPLFASQIEASLRPA